MPNIIILQDGEFKAAVESTESRDFWLTQNGYEGCTTIEVSDDDYRQLCRARKKFEAGSIQDIGTDLDAQEISIDIGMCFDHLHKHREMLEDRIKNFENAPNQWTTDLNNINTIISNLNQADFPINAQSYVDALAKIGINVPCPMEHYG